MEISENIDHIEALFVFLFVRYGHM